MPTADELLGPAPKLPNANDLLDAPQSSGILSIMRRAIVPWQPSDTPSSAAMDEYLKNSGTGHILSAFGQGAAEGWGTGNLGFSPETEEGLKQAGIFNDVAKGQSSIVKSFNEALMRPVAAAVDAFVRGGGALFRGAQAAVEQTGAEAGAPQLGQAVAGAPEAFMGSPGSALGHLGEARELGVIGGSEGVWKGTEEPKVAPESVVRDAAHQAAANANEPGALPFAYDNGAAGVPSEGPAVQPYAPSLAPGHVPLDVHEAARQVAPDTFQEYDTLSAQRDALREQIAQAGNDLRQKAEAQAPHAAEIADLEDRLQDTTPRLAKKYQARLDELIPQRDKFLSDDFTIGALTRDTPEMTGMREKLQQLDYRMRDLAPDVTAAYRQAAQQFPPQGVSESTIESPQAPGAAPIAAPIAASIETPPEPTPVPIKPAEPQPSPPQPVPVPVNIAQDVTAKLTAAGRPTDEAQAAAALVEAHYDARAARFGGAKGTAAEMYATDAPEVRSGVSGGRKGGAAGKAFIRDGKTTITLFAKADASTFMHETAHHWLEELLGDAKDDAAPQGLRDDAGAVRDWLGMEGDTLTGRQHERFARGFEQYLMEGRAPSQALAGVFAKFKDWLTTIYQTLAKLGKPISSDIRDVYDRLLAAEPDQQAVVAPETPARAAIEDVKYPAKGLKETTPFEREPKEPVRLVQFLRGEGGIKDVGGDIRHTLGGSKYRPGLINNKSGLSLDDAAMRAWRAGYFPEFGDERPDINALRNAIEDDLKGTPRYSHKDEGALDEYHAALDRNKEIERLSYEHGIDTKGLTRDQFFDKVTEKLSAEKIEAEIRSQEDAHQAAFDEMASEAREYVAPGEDVWDADEFYGIGGGPRTLEDLENAYRQENATRPAGQGETGHEQPGYAGGPAANGEAGDGSRGRGLGPTGRDGEAAGATSTIEAPRAEPPTSPNATFGPAAGLVDKAGNIRLDLLNQPEDVNAVIREAADQNADFIGARRGVVSDAQVLDLADALGMDAKALNRRKLGEAFNAEQVVAARKLLIQSATETRDAMAKAATGSDADVMAYAEAKARHQMIQQQVAGITAEAGRALRAFREMKAVPGAEKAEAVGKFLQDATGKTLFQLRREATAGMQLDTPGKVSGFINDVDKPGIGAMALEVFKNWLISGPITHMIYSEGNTLLALSKAIPETAAEAAIGAVREAVTGQKQERAYFGEMGAQLYGMLRGQRNGIQAAWDSVKAGQTMPLPGERGASTPFTQSKAIPGVAGSVVRAPGERMVAPIHSYFRSIGYAQGIARQAYRTAINEGLTGDDFAKRIAELTRSPTPEMMEAARDEATQQTLMGRGGALTQRVSSLVNWEPSVPLLGPTKPLAFIDPFVHIASNIMEQAVLERSPLGVFSQQIRDDMAGKNGTLRQNSAIARMAVGTSLSVVGMGLTMEGLLTTSAPSDPRERAMWTMTNGMPHAFKIGDTAYDMSRLGVLGFQLGISADLYHAAAMMGQEDITKIGSLLVHSFAQNFLDEGFMRGPSDLIKALDDPDHYGASYLRNFASSMAVPFSVGMSQIARQVDPYARSARTLMDEIKSKVPWWSESLTPRYDLWGQPVLNRGLAGVYEQRLQNDPVNQTITKLGQFPSMPERRIRGVQLTEDQYGEYSKTAGRMAKQRLDALVRMPEFHAIPPGQQTKVIHDTIGSARETARTMMLMKYPEIIQKATEAKKALLAP